MVTPVAKREAAAHLCTAHGVSQRRACKVLKVDRSSIRYRSIRPDDGALREAMKKVASERRRFGYRRIHLMLQRQGIAMNHKKLRRLYREEKLQGQAERWQEACLGHQKAHIAARRYQSALVAGLRIGCLHRRSPVPCFGRSR
jgi:putative transposase